MATEINFGVYVNPEVPSRIKLSSIDLKTKVNTMKTIVSEKTNLQQDSIGK